MPIALYGKLPAKRDFIAEAVPRGFLETFEPWLQGMLAASRLRLGTDWQRLFYGAPLWRFHLGPGHCGRALLGALMPSVDGVGRPFPLVAFAAAPEGCTFPSPLADPQGPWFEALEGFLLSTLDIGDFARILSSRAALDAPTHVDQPPLPEAVTALRGTLAVLGQAFVEAPQEAVAQADAHLRVVFSSFWWTVGGAAFPAAALCGRTFPDADTFSGMLTGDWSLRPRPPDRAA